MEKWIIEIDNITALYIAHFEGLTEEELNWVPNEGTWSVAQNINHVIELNTSYFKKFDEFKRGKNQLGFIARLPWVVNFLGNTIKQFASPDRQRKTKTFKMWEQTNQHFPLSILNDFQNHQLELKKYVIEMDYWIRNNKMISSPATNFIVFKVGDVFEILIPHELRHFNQAKEVIETMQTINRN